MSCPTFPFVILAKAGIKKRQILKIPHPLNFDKRNITKDFASK